MYMRAHASYIMCFEMSSSQHSDRDATVSGFCHPLYENVRRTFRQNLVSGSELGASVAVTVRGELVVDLWGGWADTAQAIPWTEQTITNVYSTTKTMTALTALVLVERGELNLSDRVAKFWPEFANCGKSSVTVSQLISHSSGLPAWNQPITIEDLYDWEKSTDLLANQEPWWTPGSQSGYHMLSFGHLIGEVVRRITGVSFGSFFKTEIAIPLGSNFRIGLDPTDLPSVSPVVILQDAPEVVPPTEIASKTLVGPPLPRGGTVVNSNAWRSAQVPAANGHGNARSVAQIQGLLTNRGEISGRKILSDKVISEAFKPIITSRDAVLGVPMTFASGFAVANLNHPTLGGRNARFWGGFGGSRIVHELDHQMTFAYVMNKLNPSAFFGDLRGDDLLKSALQSTDSYHAENQ